MLSDSQIADRILGIGGSDMATIFGLSTYKTPYQLFLEKTGAVKSTFKMTEQQYWGHKHEPTIRDEFALRHNVAVFTPDTLIHTKYPFMRANIDGFIPDLNSVLEVKTCDVSKAYEWGNEDSDEIPLPYIVQVAFYCLVVESSMNVEVNTSHIAVLIGGNKYKEFIYTRNLALEVKIIDTCQEFWNAINNKIPPPPVNEKDLFLMYPRHKEFQSIDADDTIIESVKGLYDIKTKTKELDQNEVRHRFDIMQYMGTAEMLKDGSNKNLVTWKTDKNGSRRFILK